MFYKGSRYENVKEAYITGNGGRVIEYKRIRFIPETKAIQMHTVLQGDRLDLISQKYFKDPLLFWRICDANITMLPDKLLEETGTTILIPLSLR